MDKPEVCPDCEGTKVSPVRGGQAGEVNYPCPTCKGTGDKPDSSELRDKIAEYLYNENEPTLIYDGVTFEKCKGIYPDLTDSYLKQADDLIAHFNPNEIIRQESESVIRCIIDAKRVHPDWGIDDIIDLLKFREETMEAMKNQSGNYVSLEELSKRSRRNDGL